LKRSDSQKGFDRIEVLERVDELILLLDPEYATVEQVANYYGLG
jgi:hypothetical protein